MHFASQAGTQAVAVARAQELAQLAGDIFQTVAGGSPQEPGA